MRLLLMLVLTTGVVCDRERPYVGFKLMNITAKSPEILDEILSSLHSVDDLWRNHTENSVLASVPPHDVTSVHQVVNQLGGRVEIRLDNLQELVDEEYLQFDLRRKKRQALSLEESLTEDFLPLDELYNFQNRVLSSCNAVDILVERETIGQSTNNNPLYVIKISKADSPPNKKTIFLEAGVHAREWLGPATANYVIYQLACSGNNMDMLDLYNWEIIPSVNPDGYHYTHVGHRYWRKNMQKNGRSRCIGTDINRNFETGFGGGGSVRSVCGNTYRGRHAYSAPESRALRDYVMRRSSDIASYLSLHAYGQYILLPWGYKNTRTGDYNKLISYAEAAETAMGLPFKIGTAAEKLYIASGISSDFAREAAGIPLSYTWELMPNSGLGLNGFSLAKETLSDNLPVIWRGLKAYIQAVAEDNPTTPVSSTEAPSYSVGATGAVGHVFESASSNTEARGTTEATTGVTSVTEAATTDSPTTTTPSSTTGPQALTRPPHVSEKTWNWIQSYKNIPIIYAMLLKRLNIPYAQTRIRFKYGI